jgi:hypothetical protein
MSLAYAVSDAQVMVTRSTRRSLRDPEAFFTALMLPIVLMLLFVYVFGGALNTGGRYVDYVVPGLIVLCAGFGAGTTAVAVATDMSNGIVDRFRSMPIASSSILIGHIAASLARNLIATTLVIGAGLGRRLAPGRLARRLDRRIRDDRAVHPRAVLARGRGRRAGPQRRGGDLAHLRPHVHSLPEHRVRARPHPARPAALDRRAPAIHSGRRGHARPVDGAHLDRGRSRPRSDAGRRLLRRDPHRLRDRCVPSLQPSNRLISNSRYSISGARVLLAVPA